MPLTWERDRGYWLGPNHVGVVEAETVQGRKRRWQQFDDDEVEPTVRKKRTSLVRPLLDNGKGKERQLEHNILDILRRRATTNPELRKTTTTSTSGLATGGDSQRTRSAGAPLDKESCNDDSSCMGSEQVNTIHASTCLERVPRPPTNPSTQTNSMFSLSLSVYSLFILFPRP